VAAAVTLSLALENVAVDRGRLPVVRDFSYANVEGGWIGLIGANGSGKTTLLRALAGRLPIRAGRILLGGRDVSGDRGARAQLIGFAVEGGFLPGNLSVRELFSICAVAPAAADAAQLRPLRRALGLDAFLDRKCSSLSAGMAQRVSLFAAFLDLPGIVILDEPFNWLDPVTAYDVKLALVRLTREQGITLITALHDVATLTAYCTRGLLLSGGRIALALEAGELAAGRSDPAGFESMVVARLRERSA
jgi:ABC-type multidrug transport system ATPase subunit